MVCLGLRSTARVVVAVNDEISAVRVRKRSLSLILNLGWTSLLGNLALALRTPQHLVKVHDDFLAGVVEVQRNFSVVVDNGVFRAQRHRERRAALQREVDVHQLDGAGCL